MLRVFGDFETFYERTIYSLSGVRALSPAEYILDNRFEMLGCGVAVDNEKPKFMPREESIAFLRSLKEPYAFISHNALFDAVILALRYDVHPDILIDTLGMARALLVHKIPSGRVRLATVLEFYGLEAKGDTVKEMSGLRFDDIEHVPDLWMRFVAYTLRDVNGCREIFNLMAPMFPPQEARIMDMVIRMATQPRLLIDEHQLEVHVLEVETAKNDLIKNAGLEKAKYMSNPKFAEALRDLNVDPPMKISVATGLLTYAFSRQDASFMELQDHPDERVQAIMAARLGVKTTIETTRAHRFLDIAKITKATFGKPWIPVPLKYSGAHTHRLSGDWLLNMQNLSNRKNNRLRAAIFAPVGYMVVAIDAAQIEARLTAWLAHQADLLDMFKNKIDTYKNFACDLYRKPLDQITKLERFNAKTCILLLGFGGGPAKLLATIRTAARENDFDVEYTLEECEEWVSKYRNRYRAIRELWYRCDHILGRMEKGKADGEKIGPCVVDGLSIVLPSGLRINYHQLMTGDDGMTYRFGAMHRKIYGAKFVENIVQALDRQHVLEAALRTEDRCAKAGLPGIKIALQVHDENVYVLSTETFRYIAQIAHEEMCRPAWWGNGLPLAAETKVGITYGELKEWTWDR